MNSQKNAFLKHGFLKHGLILFLSIVCVAAIFHVFQKRAAKRVAAQVYEVLDTYRLTDDIDACSIGATSGVGATSVKAPLPVVGRTEYIEQIAHFIGQGAALPFLTVAFPFKSINHVKKTLGNLPDMAERKSLEYLQGMLDAIKKVYPKGAHLTIFCDGIQFAQFFNVDAADVQRYEKALQALITDLPDIKLSTSSHFMIEHHLRRNEDINRVIDAFGENSGSISDTLRKRIALEFDHPAGQLFLEKHSLESLMAGFVVRQKNLQAFVQSKFPSSKWLRLTVHFSSDVSKKFSVKLSPDSCVAPYHGVLVEEHDGSWKIRFRKDIDVTKYTLLTKVVNGVHCLYYKSL